MVRRRSTVRFRKGAPASAIYSNTEPGSRAFVSGKKKQNTKKAAVITGGDGRTLWAGAFRPGRMQVQAPPLKPKKDATPEESAACEAERHKQSSERICVEHASAEHKQWRTLQRYLGRRENFDETFLAVAGLVSDRAAER